MAYEFYTAYRTIAKTPPVQIREDYQQVIDQEFEVASSVYDIDEETAIGTQLWQTTNVRVNHVINATTGVKRGDDYKQIIFPDFSHARAIGYRYRFNDNIWLGISTDNYKYVTASIVVRRCNNSFKWIDSNGVLQKEPCVIDYDYSMTTLQQEQHIIVPDGTIIVYVQNNSKSKSIFINQRFLFGEQAYVVKSNKNWDNNFTLDDTTVPILQLRLEKVALNPETDDVANNVADRFTTNYSILINQPPFTQAVGFSGTLTATVKNNEEIVSKPVTWTSSNSAVATIGATTGVYNLLSTGNVTFTATLTDNSSVHASVPVTVAAPTNTFSVVFSPQILSIKQGMSQNYSVTLLKDGVSQPATFTVTASGATLDKYKLTQIDGNNFSVQCLKSGGTVTVSATDGMHVGTINIALAGLW